MVLEVPEPSDPIQRFHETFALATSAEPFDASRCALATVRDNRPSVRMVLVKHVDERGFVFFTNYESRKAEDIAANPNAALCFHWWTIGQQVRVEGWVERVAAAESDAYFALRPRGSQLAAWVSAQSQPIASRDELLAKLESTTNLYHGRDVPRPPFWGGFRVVPETIEFWFNREHRLHDRVCYHREGSRFGVTRLAP